MRKIGLFALALVLALGGLGIGYAEWTDTLTIDATVNTGDVNLDVVAVSSTFVYKVPGAPDIGYGLETVVNYVHGSTDPNPPVGGIEIATAIATDTSAGGVNTVSIVYSNLFPSIWFYTDIVLHYAGSIPVKVNDAWLQVDPNYADFGMALSQLDFDLTLGFWDPQTHEWGDDVVIGTQLHQSNYIKILVGIHVPQDNDLMNKETRLETGFEVIQWNEFGQ